MHVSTQRSIQDEVCLSLSTPNGRSLSDVVARAVDVRRSHTAQADQPRLCHTPEPALSHCTPRHTPESTEGYQAEKAKMEVREEEKKERKEEVWTLMDRKSRKRAVQSQT